LPCAQMTHSAGDGGTGWAGRSRRSVSWCMDGGGSGSTRRSVGQRAVPTITSSALMGVVALSTNIADGVWENGGRWVESTALECVDVDDRTTGGGVQSWLGAGECTGDNRRDCNGGLLSRGCRRSSNTRQTGCQYVGMIVVTDEDVGVWTCGDRFLVTCESVERCVAGAWW
jgi:hypothetical protein